MKSTVGLIAFVMLLKYAYIWTIIIDFYRDHFEYELDS